MNSSVYKQFEDIYENVMKKGVTFSEDMGNEIHKELEKMVSQRNEWLKEHSEKENDRDKMDGKTN